MASDKNKAKAAAATTKNEVDLTKIALPEGWSADDFEQAGGLLPLAPPELNQNSTIIAYIVACLDMPKRKSDGSDWKGLLVQIIVGTAKVKDSEDNVSEVGAGENIIIPVGGSLKANKDVMAVAFDPNTVVPGAFTVVGQVDTGKRDPMWDYDVKLNFKRAAPRRGIFALYNREVGGSLPAAPSEVLNKDGTKARSLVG
jgi:hypothetical protein